MKMKENSPDKSFNASGAYWNGVVGGGDVDKEK